MIECSEMPNNAHSLQYFVALVIKHLIEKHAGSNKLCTFYTYAYYYYIICVRAILNCSNPNWARLQIRKHLVAYSALSSAEFKIFFCLSIKMLMSLSTVLWLPIYSITKLKNIFKTRENHQVLSL